MDLISVIVPVYNVEKYIAECIESILNQTHTNLELLLIDDGSTDSSAEICNKYVMIDNRVKVFHVENSGVSAARNLGLKLATGNYIGFVDSDDFIETKMYKIMLHNLIEKNSQMCICTKYLRNLKVLYNSKLNIDVLNKTDSMKNILSYNFPTSLWSCLYKKEIIKNLYLKEDIHHLEDLEFQFRVLKNVKKVAVCGDALYNYRYREGSANTSGFNKKVLSSLKVLPTIEEYIINNNDIEKKYISVTRSRLTLTVAAFMARYNHSDKDIEKILNDNARISWMETLSSSVEYKKKILISLLAISYKLFALSYRLIKNR